MSPDFQNCKNTAYQLFEKVVKYGFPICCTSAIKETQKKICLMPYGKQINPQLLEKYSEDGFSMADNDVYIIAFNEEKPQNRIRWTIAHELGHILLRHLENPEFNGENNRVFEVEANEFAKHLLCPPMLIFDLADIIDPIDDEALSKIFGISSEAATKIINYFNDYFEFVYNDYRNYEHKKPMWTKELQKICELKLSEAYMVS